MNVEHYTCRVVCSPEDEAFVATVADFPSPSWIADPCESAQERIMELMVENDRVLRQLVNKNAVYYPTRIIVIR